MIFYYFDTYIELAIKTSKIENEKIITKSLGRTNSNMVICLSGDYRSGKSGFATHLVNQIGLNHYSMRKKVDAENQKYNLNRVDWNKVLLDYTDNQIEEYILNLAKSGDCILDFRFSALLCRKHNIDYIGIYITADIEARVCGNAMCWNLSKEQTLDIINQRETQEIKKSYCLYNKSYKDADLYNLVFDFTSKWYDTRFLNNGFDYTKEILAVEKYINQKRYNDED